MPKQPDWADKLSIYMYMHCRGLADFLVKIIQLNYSSFILSRPIEELISKGTALTTI